MFLHICLVGIVLNVICLITMIFKSKDPNGAMGAGIFLVLCLVPYLLVLGLIASKVSDYFDWGK